MYLISIFVLGEFLPQMVERGLLCSKKEVRLAGTPPFVLIVSFMSLSHLHAVNDEYSLLRISYTTTLKVVVTLNFEL